MAPQRREANPQRARLGQRLRELRAGRFRHAAELARELGWQQTKVSKLELGQQVPSASDLDAWLTAVHAGPEVRAEIGELLTKARLAYRVWSEEYQAGTIAHTQAEIGEIEAEASLIREYRPAQMPGIVHTVAYAREILTIPAGVVLTGAAPEHLDELIAARLKRQQLLYQPGRLVQILLGEAALRVYFGSVPALLGQLDRLIVLAGLDTVEIGILPYRDPSPLMQFGFSLHDTDTLTVETLTREIESRDPDEIEIHAKVFEIAWEVALKGPDAVALIRRVAAELHDAQPGEPSRIGPSRVKRSTGDNSAS